MRVTIKVGKIVGAIVKQLATQKLQIEKAQIKK